MNAEKVYNLLMRIMFDEGGQCAWDGCRVEKWEEHDSSCPFPELLKVTEWIKAELERLYYLEKLLKARDKEPDAATMNRRISAVRHETGAGRHDCERHLRASGWDMEAAIKNLRTEGMT